MTTALDLLGIGSIAVFAFLVWPPAGLLVIGLAALVVSWRASR